MKRHLAGRLLAVLLSVTMAVSLLYSAGFGGKAQAASEGPTITTQPVDKNLLVGSTAKFTVAATGSGTLTYRWQYRKDASSEWAASGQQGAKTNTLYVSATAGLHGYQFRCVVTDGNGQKAYSNAATLTLKPRITTQPVDKSLLVGSTAKFTVAATGKGTLKYQWQYRKNASSAWAASGQQGAKTNTLYVSATAGLHGYQFRCIVTDGNGKKTYSSAATLTLKPRITTQPTGKSVTPGTKAQFTVAATGKSTLTYQWQFRKDSSSAWANSAQSGNKTATLSVAATKGLNGYQFRCAVTDGNGQTTYSSAATLKVFGILKQPVSYSVPAGVLSQFSVTAGGTGLTYQWQYRRNASDTWKNSAQSGNKTATLSVATTEALNGYQFRCIVKDGAGNSATSNAATLTIGELVIDAHVFPDEAFRNYIAENVDSDESGTLSADEILGRTWLRVYDHVEMYGYAGIGAADLKGVEIFANLEELVCSGNLLTKLDLSRNKELTWLECKGNRLTSLDLSGFTQLTYLNCSDNLLTSLNIGDCTQLAALSCEGNRLTSLDVSAFTKMEILYCSNNQLTSLNVSNCTSLKILDCRGNRLTSLDLSYDGKMSQVDCSYNQLTSLNVAGLEELHTLKCNSNLLKSLSLSGCSGVQEVYCQDNQLESLTFSGNSKLSWLDCSNNKLKTLNTAVLPGLKMLNCRDNQLTTLTVSNCPDLNTLFCENNKLTELLLQNNAILRVLYCENNSLTALNTSANPELHTLRAKGNALGSLDLRNNTSLGYVSTDVAIILVQPKPYEAAINGKAVFTVVADGDGIKYQWQYRTSASSSWANTDLTGCRTNILAFTATSSMNGYQFRCVVTDKNGVSVASDAVKLTVGTITIDENRFPDDIFRSFISENIDTSGDGTLSAAELAAVKTLNVAGMDIESLRGLEYFTEAETLYCGSYYVTEETWGGYRSNSLTGLDLSRNINLKELDCNNNYLNKLDVRTCKKLQSLECSWNGLSSIDLRYCTELENFRGGMLTKLSALDFTCNRHLKTLDIYWINLVERTLDLSNNTEAEVLRIGGAGIDHIDLTNNTNLKILEIEPDVTVTGLCEGAVRIEYEN